MGGRCRECLVLLGDAISAYAGRCGPDAQRWSPDGNTLYFISQFDRFCCIWARRLDPMKRPVGGPIAIFHAHEARRSLLNIGKGDLGISIARDRIVFNINERSGNIWMAKLQPEKR